jgi:hypothetical protein
LRSDRFVHFSDVQLKDVQLKNPATEFRIVARSKQVTVQGIRMHSDSSNPYEPPRQQAEEMVEATPINNWPTVTESIFR